MGWSGRVVERGEEGDWEWKVVRGGWEWKVVRGDWEWESRGGRT